MFQALIDGMTALINFLYGVTVAIGIPNYGLAIILLTVLIKVVLHPLTQVQMRSMSQLSQLQPKIKAIQEKYGKDKQQVQLKTMELYKERKVNPMSGCLLLLVQLPILIALYRALFNFDFANAVHAKFLWVPALSATDPFFALPILAAVTTYIQSKMSTSLSAGGGGNPAQESTQRVMLTVMPLFIGWISATLPAGLALYWVTFNGVGIIQQRLINKQLLPDKAGEPETASKSVGREVRELEVTAGGQAASNPGKESSAKGKSRPGKEEVTQGESGRRKRKKHR